MRSPAALDKTTDLVSQSNTLPGQSTDTFEPVSIRVSPHGYFGAIFAGSFLTAFLLYLEFERAAMAAFFFFWVIIPFVAFRDRITFDGKKLVRTGYFPRIWSWLTVRRTRLKLADIERVETQAIRVLKQGSNVYYRYRTCFRGKGLSVAIASGGEDFRRMVRSILVRLPDASLDNRSIDLRDHLVDPKESLMKAEFSRIPAPDVLEPLLFRRNLRSDYELNPRESDSDPDAFEELHSLANELRIGGFLLQSLEAFRRALVLKPGDARLIFDLARCLYSLAGVKRDKAIEHRSLAAMRLARARAGEDVELKARIGEWYFQIGEWNLAAAAFRGVLEKAGADFRAALGLAELALREGKLAHVIHNFSAALRSAGTPGLRRWLRNETAYFSNLHFDDEYLEIEVKRVSTLASIDVLRKTALRIAVLALPVVVVGVVFQDELVSNLGWAISAFALVGWIILIISYRMMSERFPYELLENEND